MPLEPIDYRQPDRVTWISVNQYRVIIGALILLIVFGLGRIVYEWQWGAARRQRTFTNALAATTRPAASATLQRRTAYEGQVSEAMQYLLRDREKGIRSLEGAIKIARQDGTLPWAGGSWPSNGEILLAKLYRIDARPPSTEAARAYADYLWANYREFRGNLATSQPANRDAREDASGLQAPGVINRR